MSLVLTLQLSSNAYGLAKSWYPIMDPSVPGPVRLIGYEFSSDFNGANAQDATDMALVESAFMTIQTQTGLQFINVDAPGAPSFPRSGKIVIERSINNAYSHAIPNLWVPDRKSVV